MRVTTLQEKLTVAEKKNAKLTKEAVSFIAMCKSKDRFILQLKQKIITITNPPVIPSNAATTVAAVPTTVDSC